MKGLKTGGRTKGIKNKATLAKEKARDYYEAEVLSDFGAIIKVHVQEAKKAKNYKERKDAIVQIIGEAPKTLNINDITDLNLNV